MPSIDQCSIAEFSNSFLVSPSPSVCTINIDGWESCKYRKMIAYSVIYAHTIGPGSKPGGYGILYTKFLTTTITP